MDNVRRRSTTTFAPERSKTRSDLPLGQDNQQQMMGLLVRLEADLTLLLKSFNDRLSYDKEKEVAFERLYRELDDLKQSRELNQFRAIFVDLILMIDRMNTIYNDKLDAGQKEDEIFTLLGNLSHEVLEILYRNGVDLVVSTSEYFDPKIQQAVKVVATNNPAEDGKLIEIVRHGFRYNEMLIRPEEVVIKKYEPLCET